MSIRPIKVEILNEEDVHSFGDFSFQIYNTPGHSLGSLTYYDPQSKLLFPGDVVFPGGNFGRYDFPGGSLQQLQNSIQRISELDVETLCAGHMEPTKNGNANIQRSLKFARMM